MFAVENGLRPAPSHQVMGRPISRYCDPGNGRETFTVSRCLEDRNVQAIYDAIPDRTEGKRLRVGMTARGYPHKFQNPSHIGDSELSFWTTLIAKPICRAQIPPQQPNWNLTDAEIPLTPRGDRANTVFNIPPGVPFKCGAHHSPTALRQQVVGRSPTACQVSKQRAEGCILRLFVYLDLQSKAEYG